MPHIHTLSLAQSMFEQAQNYLNSLFGETDSLFWLTLLSGFIFGMLCSSSATRKGYNPHIWFIFGFLGGIFALLVLALFPAREEELHPTTQKRSQNGHEVPHRPTWIDFQIPPEPEDEPKNNEEVEIGKGDPPKWNY